MNKKNKKPIILLMLALAIAVSVSSCLKDDDEDKTYSAAEEKELREAYLQDLIEKDHDIDTTANGVYYIVIEEGEGDLASEGDSLVVGYAGYFIGGQLFDSSELRGDGKMRFVLGQDRMIEGWEDAMTVMNEGSTMQFIVPSELAYGAQGQGLIPPYQTLVFVIKLFEIHSEEETN